MSRSYQNLMPTLPTSNNPSPLTNVNPINSNVEVMNCNENSSPNNPPEIKNRPKTSRIKMSRKFPQFPRDSIYKYVHPTISCSKFPNCPLGWECPDGAHCMKITCTYVHIEINPPPPNPPAPTSTPPPRQTGGQGREPQGTGTRIARADDSLPASIAPPCPGTRIDSPPPAYEEIMGESTQNNDYSDYSVECEVCSYNENGFYHKFEIENILGEGAYGIVFQSISIGDGAKYAVKRISIESCEITKLKVRREISAMSQLDHPGIVRYQSSWMETPPKTWQLDKDVDFLKRFSANIPKYLGKNMTATFMYIQMEMCMYSLSDWLENRQDGARIYHWFNQIVSAVAYIHDRGFFHRDLKPSNILFSDPDTVKICDLGTATLRTLDKGEELTSTYTSIGTPLYMAPEQNWGKYKSKVDVFALGLILAELCVVMSGKERLDTFNKYREGKPNDFLKNEPETAAFISWLTLVDPKERPTCNEVLQHDFLASKKLSS